jgi:predicted ATPase
MDGVAQRAWFLPIVNLADLRVVVVEKSVCNVAKVVGSTATRLDCSMSPYTAETVGRVRLQDPSV